MKSLATESIAPATPSTCAAQLLDVTPLVMRRIRREMRTRAMPGLSLPQFRTLFYLRKHPRASLSEVAGFLGLTLPSASKLVQRLVAQKIVARRVGQDRRRICLSLTEQGRAALEAARMETREQLAANLRSLSLDELEAVSAALQVLGRAFSESDTHVHLP